MLGLISSAYFLAVFAFAIPAGRLSDHLGRKPLAVIGTLIFALATLLFVTTTNPWWFVVFRVLEGLGAALFMPASRAFVAEITRHEDRSRARPSAPGAFPRTEVRVDDRPARGTMRARAGRRPQSRPDALLPGRGAERRPTAHRR